MNDLLQELDAKTGKSIMSFGTNGVVDLRVGIDGRDPATIGDISVGHARRDLREPDPARQRTGEGYLSPPGDLRAYDVLTGKLVWKFHTVPHPGEFGYETWPKDAWKYIGGTNTWGELSVDTARGIAYFPTGSPTYDYYGADRIGANLFGTSIVALDARTGKRLWHFQMVHHDLWDFDNNAAPQLTTIRHNGRNRDVVALAGKTGCLYVFDRVTGDPIWPIEERPVPTDRDARRADLADAAVPDQAAALRQAVVHRGRHQPVPTARPNTRRSRARPRGQQQGALHTDHFTDTLHIPGSNGGALFGTTAAEPRTGAVYVITQDNPGILRLLRPGESRPRRWRRAAAPGQPVYQQNCQVCHGAGSRLERTTACRSSTRPPIRSTTFVAGAPRFDAAAIRTAVRTGKGRMPALPHLSDS